MENIQQKVQDFLDGIKTIETKHAVDYSIMKYIELTPLSDNPVIFKRGLDRKIRKDVILMRKKIW